MRPIPTIEDPERYIDSAFVDSSFIEFVKSMAPPVVWAGGTFVSGTGSETNLQIAALLFASGSSSK